MFKIPCLWIYGLETLTSIDEKKNTSLRTISQADVHAKKRKEKKKKNNGPIPN